MLFRSVAFPSLEELVLLASSITGPTVGITVLLVLEDCVMETIWVSRCSGL